MAEVPSVEKKEETTATETVINPDGTTTTTESKTTKESRAGFSQEKVESKSETVTPKGFWERHKAKRQAKSEARATATKGRSPILGWFGTSARKVRRVATDERSQVMLDERVTLENDIRDRRLKSQAEVLTHLEDLRQGIADNLTLFGHDHDRFGAMQHELDKVKQMLELHTEPSIEREALVATRMELEADIEAVLTPKDRAEYSQLVKRQEAVDALYGEQLVKKAKEGVGSLSQAERSFMLHDLVNRGLDSAFSDITAKAKGFANMQDALRLMDINDVMATSEEVHGQAGVVTGKQYKRKWLDTLPGGVRKVLEMAGVGREGSSMNKVAQWDSFQDRLPRYWRERWTDLKRTGVGVGIAGAIALAAPISLPAVLVGAGGALAFRAVSDYVYRERKQHAENEAGVALNRLAFNELSETILKAREEALRYQRQVVGAPKEQLEEIQGHALNRIVDAMLKTQTTAVDEFKRIERVGKVVNAISGAVGGIAAGATWGAFQYHEKVAAAQELAKEGLWMKGANLVNLDLSQIDPSQISPERLAQLQTYQERFEQLRGMLGGVDQATTVVVNPDGAVSDGHAVEFVKNGWHRLVDTHGDRDLDQILSLLQEGKGGEFTAFVNQGDAAQMLTNYASDGTYHHVADHVGPLGHLLKHHWPEVYAALARDAVLGGGILGGLMGVGGSKVRSKRSDRLDPAEALALVDDRFPLRGNDYYTPEAEHLRAKAGEWRAYYGIGNESPTEEQVARRTLPEGVVIDVKVDPEGYLVRVIGKADGAFVAERIPVPTKKDEDTGTEGGGTNVPATPPPGPEGPPVSTPHAETPTSETERAETEEETGPSPSAPLTEPAPNVEEQENEAEDPEKITPEENEERLREAYKTRLTRVAQTFALGIEPLEHHTWLRAFYRPAGGHKAEKLPAEIENLATLRHVLGIAVPDRRNFSGPAEHRRALLATLDEIWPALERSVDVLSEVSYGTSGREREFYDAMNGYLSTAYAMLLDSPISNLHQLRVAMSKNTDQRVEAATPSGVESGTQKQREQFASIVRQVGMGYTLWEKFEAFLDSAPKVPWIREVLEEMTRANATEGILEAARRGLAYWDAQGAPKDIGEEFLAAFGDANTVQEAAADVEVEPSAVVETPADQLPTYEWAQLPSDHVFEAVGKFGINQLPDPETSPVPFSDFVVRLLMDGKSAVLYDPKAVHEIIRQQIQERERQGSLAVEIDTLYATDLLSSAVDAAIKKEQTSEKIAEQFSSQTLQEAYVPKVLAQTLSRLASLIRTGIAGDEVAAKQLDQVARILEARS